MIEMNQIFISDDTQEDHNFIQQTLSVNTTNKLQTSLDALKRGKSARYDLKNMRLKQGIATNPSKDFSNSKKFKIAKPKNLENQLEAPNDHPLAHNRGNHDVNISTRLRSAYHIQQEGLNQMRVNTNYNSNLQNNYKKILSPHSQVKVSNLGFGSLKQGSKSAMHKNIPSTVNQLSSSLDNPLSQVDLFHVQLTGNDSVHN